MVKLFIEEYINLTADATVEVPKIKMVPREAMPKEIAAGIPRNISANAVGHFHHDGLQVLSSRRTRLFIAYANIKNLICDLLLCSARMNGLILFDVDFNFSSLYCAAIGSAFSINKKEPIGLAFYK